MNQDILKIIIVLISLSLNLHSQSSDLDLLPSELRDKINELDSESSNEESNKLIQANLDNTKENIQQLKKETSEKFGFDFFYTKPNIASEVLDIPLGANYKISYGDTLEVLLVGEVNELYKISVDLSGSLIIPNVGKVVVKELTLQDAEIKLNNLIEKRYLQTTANLTVAEASLKKISIIGSVSNPGTYVVNPFTTALESISYAGGPMEQASLRNISINSSNGNSQTIDLYDFLISGERDSDVSLQNGDTVVVRSTDNYAEVKGQVLREGIYEYSANDTFEQIIDYALGVNSYANESNIYATFLNDNQIINERINLDEKIGSRILTQLYVGKKEVIDNKMIFVQGSEVTDGFYEYNNNQSLKSVLDKLFFSNDIYPFYSILKHESAFGVFFETFALGDPSTYDNINLKNNPELFFFSKEEIITFFEQKSLEDEFLQQEIRSGFSDKSQSNQLFKGKDYYKFIKVSELIPLIIGDRNFRIPLKGKISPRIIYDYFGINSDVQVSDVTVKTKTDVIESAYNNIVDASEISFISLPNNDEDVFFVTIDGRVNNPGRYLVNSDTTVNDMYKIAGGLRDNASLNGIIFTRESIKTKEIKAIESSRKVLADILVANIANPLSPSSVSMDIEGILNLASDVNPVGRLVGALSPDSQLSVSTALRPGDAIFVPAQLNSITIIGEVLNPITIGLEEQYSIDDYIEFSGGLTEFADESNIYIIQPNGESFIYSKTFFTKEKYLNPGDTIVVPRDIERLSAIPAVSIAAKILADISFAAASLNSLSN